MFASIKKQSMRNSLPIKRKKNIHNLVIEWTYSLCTILNVKLFKGLIRYIDIVGFARLVQVRAFGL